MGNDMTDEEFEKKVKVLRNLILHYHERLLRGGFNEWEIEIRIYLTPETYNKMKIEASKRFYSFKLENKNNERHPTFMNHDIITNDEIKKDCVFTGIKNEF